MKCPEPCGFRAGVRKWISGQTGPLTIFIKKVFLEHSCPPPLVYMLSRLHLSMAEWNAADRAVAHIAQNIYYLKFHLYRKSSPTPDYINTMEYFQERNDSAPQDYNFDSYLFLSPS